MYGQWGSLLTDSKLSISSPAVPIFKLFSLQSSIYCGVLFSIVSILKENITMLPMGKSIISMAIFNGKLLNNEKNN